MPSRRRRLTCADSIRSAQNRTPSRRYALSRCAQNAAHNARREHVVRVAHTAGSVTLLELVLLYAVSARGRDVTVRHRSAPWGEADRCRCARDRALILDTSVVIERARSRRSGRLRWCLESRRCRSRASNRTRQGGEEHRGGMRLNRRSHITSAGHVRQRLLTRSAAQRRRGDAPQAFNAAVPDTHSLGHLADAVLGRRPSDARSEVGPYGRGRHSRTASVLRACCDASELGHRDVAADGVRLIPPRRRPSEIACSRHPAPGRTTSQRSGAISRWPAPVDGGRTRSGRVRRRGSTGRP